MPECPRDWQTPVQPRLVVRAFQAPAQPWQAGHRGVDLAANLGQAVQASADGVVRFAGQVAGKPVISVTHCTTGEVEVISSYEPVRTDLRRGQEVSAGHDLGTVAAGDHCPDQRCLHWSVFTLTPADDGTRPMKMYENPLLWLASGDNPAPGDESGGDTPGQGPTSGVGTQRPSGQPSPGSPRPGPSLPSRRSSPSPSTGALLPHPPSATTSSTPPVPVSSTPASAPQPTAQSSTQAYAQQPGSPAPSAPAPSEGVEALANSPTTITVVDRQPHPGPRWWVIAGVLLTIGLCATLITLHHRRHNPRPG